MFYDNCSMSWRKVYLPHMIVPITKAKNLKGAVILLRSDLNVETTKDSFKLSRALPTIAYLKGQGAITVLMSHRGRPKGVDMKQSLKSLIPYLKKHIGKVTFIASHDEGGLVQAVQKAKAGEVLLLENLRFHTGEDACDMKWAKQLASVADVYVNDAFASHHQGATVSLLPKLLPHYIGLQMEAELKALSQVMKKPKQPLVVILAGGKAADKFAVIEYLHNKAKTFLVGGVLANTFFASAGMKVDGSVVDKALLTSVAKLDKDPKIVLPKDWIADGDAILDLGPLSAADYAQIIQKAGTVIWNGPMGRFEDKRFLAGSVAIAKAIAKSKAFSVVGGGETTSLFMQLGLDKKVGFLSTGGGAMLAFLSGKPHAGLVALEYKSKQ